MNLQSREAQEQLLKLLGFFVVSALAAATSVLVAFCRLDVVGFSFFVIAAAFAIAAGQMTKRWVLRLVPPLFLVGALASCVATNSAAFAWGRSVAASVVARCTRDRTCPAVPDGFTTTSSLSPVDNVELALAQSRIHLSYRLTDDGRSFRLRVIGPVTTSWWSGGVDRAAVADPYVAPVD